MQAGSYRLVYFLLPVCYDKQKGGEYMIYSSHYPFLIARSAVYNWKYVCYNIFIKKYEGETL